MITENRVLHPVRLTILSSLDEISLPLGAWPGATTKALCDISSELAMSHGVNELEVLVKGSPSIAREEAALPGLGWIDVLRVKYFRPSD